MKKIKIKMFGRLCVLLTMMLLINCNELTDNLSTDPVNVTDPSVIATSKYMSGVEVSVIGSYEGDIARLAGMWCGYFSGEDRQYAGIGNYVVSGQDFNVLWANIYTSVFANTKLLKQNARRSNNFVSEGIAQAIEGMNIGLAADLWGDVPFTGITSYPSNATPSFDSQADVYASAQVLLDSAISNLDKSGNADGDFLMDGDTDAWIAVAHTIKARLYLHTRNYPKAIEEASSGIGSTAGNMMATHGEAYLQNFNMYYSFMTYDRSSYLGANSFAPALLDNTTAISRNNSKTDETARLNYYYYPGGGLNFSEISYEPNVQCAFDDWDNPEDQDGFFGGKTSFPIVTFEENQLILAEAYAKNSDVDNALASLNLLRAYYATGAHVNSGYLSLGYNYEAYTSSDFEPGGIENGDNIAMDKALLREILEERYVTLIGQIEGYNDMRRTGNLLNIPLPAGKTDFPKRGLYAQNEVNTNPNVPTSSVGLYDPVTAFSTPY
ncbi:MAG: SusD/RagB family nutrient-binding outer membrane lipoprotein [Chryseolinea sp.]